MFYLRSLIFLLVFLLIFSCNQKEKKQDSSISSTESITLTHHASSFEIQDFGSYYTVEIKTPWPDSDKGFKYLLVREGVEVPGSENFDEVLQIPVKTIAVTSTTHIPSLEMLGVENALIGFPNPDFISSEKTRKRIKEGKIKDFGKNEDINTEILIELSPDVLVGFGMDGTNPSFPLIRKSGIPVLYNADWTETSPLGKAEWIKFFGVLFDKTEEAEEIFNDIVTQYNEAKALALQSKTKPTVISGAMYRDIWYVPQGNSWGARFIEDAHGDYLWKDSPGTGSLALNLEQVIEKGLEAEFWIGPGQFTSFSELKDASASYSKFEAFQNKNIFTYNLRKGEKGGSVYFELAPNRPDLVLKDMIKILHPELLEDYEPYFFDKLR